MTQIKTKIPAELEPAAVGGMVTDSKYVKDRVKNKTQEEVNADTEERVSTLEESVGTGGSVDERIAVEKNRAEQAEGVLDGKVATEKQRAEGVEGGLNTRLQTVEQLAEISVGGGDIGIGTAADFESDDPEDQAKVPTIGAILGSMDDEPTAGSDNLVTSDGVAKQFGILDEANIVGNNSSWALYSDSHVIIKSGESVRIKLNGPITFAGTNVEQTFLKIYWRTIESSTAHPIIDDKGDVETINNYEIDFTATEDCYLCYEGRWHDTETLNVIVQTGIIKQVEDNANNIASLQSQAIEAQQNITSLDGLLETDDYTHQGAYDIVKGSMYNGDLDTSSNDCLTHKDFIKVYPNTKIHCIHANDIKIRVTEFNGAKTYIKQTEYAKFESLALSSNTSFIKVSGSYEERGYSASNPISTSVYQEGDFGAEITDSNRLKALERCTERLIDDYEDKFYFVDGSTWKNGGGTFHVRVIPVVGGTTIFCKANPNVATRIAFLKSFDEESIIANLPVAVDGTGNENTEAGQTRTYNVPKTCTYIAISSFYGKDALPDILIIDGVSYIDNTKKLLLDNIDKTSDIEAAIGGIETELVESFTVRKGTIWEGNAGPSNDCLYGEEYFEVIGGSIIEVFSADYVKTRISEYDANKVYITSSGIYSFLKKIKLNKSTRYVRISGAYSDNTYTSENPITVEHFTLGDFCFNRKKSKCNIEDINNGVFSSIIGRNIQKDTAVRATGAKAVTNDIKPFSFIHISDIHTRGNNYKCFENACEFLQHYSNIKCMIATGDLVWDTYADPTTWYDIALAKTNKPVLNVIGNHDAGQYNAAEGLGSQSSDKQCYDKFIAPYVNAGTLPNGVAVPGWGVVQPANAATEGKSYYYKDFTEEKIRLIVLCEFETDYEINQEGTRLVYSREVRAMRQAQVTWLIDTLTNTPSDYGVIVAYHQPDALASEDNAFVSFDLTAEYRSAHGEGATIALVYCEDEQWLPKILNAFATKSSLTLTVTQTGAVVTSSPTLVCDCDFTNVQSEFICILNGHTHRDYIGHHFNYPALTVLCVGADNLRYTSSFQPRLEGTPSEDLFNVVNIDRNRKTIKIIRIGSDASVTGQVRDQMIMSYATT